MESRAELSPLRWAKTRHLPFREESITPMKIRRAALFGVMIGTVLGAAESDIQFAGVVTAEGKTRIALTDKSAKSTTWVEPGQQFKDYTVARYDEKEEAVYLKKGGRETRLGLISPKATEPRPAVAENPAAVAQAAAVATAIRSNLRQLANAARQVPADRGVNSVGYTDLVGPDKMIKELKPVAGENYSTINFGPSVTAVSVTTSSGAIVTYEIPQANAAASAPAPASPSPGSPVGPTTPPAPPAPRAP